MQVRSWLCHLSFSAAAAWRCLGKPCQPAQPLQGQPPGGWQLPAGVGSRQPAGLPALPALPPPWAGGATQSASQLSQASQLTAAQRARAEANREEALRRRAEAEQQRQQQSDVSGAAGLCMAPWPAPSTPAFCNPASAAGTFPDTAAGRPPSEVRSLFTTPSNCATGLQHVRHTSQHSTHSQPPLERPVSGTWTLQAAAQRQQHPWQAPTSAVASQGRGAWQSPLPLHRQQHPAQHPSSRQHQQAQHQQWHQPAQGGRPEQVALTAPPSAQPQSRPGSALATIFSSGRPQSAGFAFQPPPGLLHASEMAHPASQQCEHPVLGSEVSGSRLMS